MKNYMPDLILTRQRLQNLQDKLADTFNFGLMLCDDNLNELTIPSRLPAECSDCANRDACDQNKLEMLKKAASSDAAVAVQIPCKMYIAVYNTGFFDWGNKKIFLLCISQTLSSIKSHIDILKTVYALPLFLGSAGTEHKIHAVQHTEYSSVDFSRLTRQELAVLRLIGQSYTNKEIADNLNVSLNTVKSHVSRLLYKLNAANRTDLAIIAINGNIK